MTHVLLAWYFAVALTTHSFGYPANVNRSIAVIGPFDNQAECKAQSQRLEAICESEFGDSICYHNYEVVAPCWSAQRR